MEGRRLLGAAREAQARLMVLALTFRITGEEKYLARARQEICDVCRVQEWNPSHFLDVAEMTLGVGLAYNWLREWLSDSERAAVEDAILNKGILPSFHGTPKDTGWISLGSNWNQVCHGGLITGALAIADSHPDWAERVVQRAITNLHFAAETYRPHGAYPEGPLYWCYGTTFHILLIEALRTGLGKDFGMADFEGFLESGDYANQMTAPSGDVFNYSDARSKRGASVVTGAMGRKLDGERIGFNTTLFWFAKELERKDLVAHELNLVRSLGSEAAGPADRFLPLSLIWWSELLRKPEKPAHEAALHWCGRGITPVAIHRSAWEDPMARFVGIKGGSPSASHAHMDVGSFVFEADGIRWAVDPGMQEYHSLESQGIKVWDGRQGGKRWDIFRIGPNGHNILRFNEHHQQVSASAEIIMFESTGTWPHTIIDLTPVYEGQIQTIKRGAALPTGGGFTLRDEWETMNDATSITWQWLTHAIAKVTPTGLLLHQGENTLIIDLESSSPWEAHVADFNEPPGAFGEKNPGLTRICVRLKTPGSSRGYLSAFCSTTNLPPTHQTLSGW